MKGNDPLTELIGKEVVAVWKETGEVRTLIGKLVSVDEHLLSIRSYDNLVVLNRADIIKIRTKKTNTGDDEK